MIVRHDEPWEGVDREALISVREVVIALKRLRPRNARTRARLLEVLGFEEAAAPARRKRGRVTPMTPDVPVAPPVLPTEPGGHGGPRERLQSVRTEPPQAATASNATLSTESGRSPQPEPPAPLFEPRWVRDIIVSMLATAAPLGDYDIDALLALLADAKPIVDIPRQRVRTLSRGAHLLVDVGEPMEPFAADQERLVTEILRIVGEDLVDVLSFRRTPAIGCGSGPLWTWKPYQTPRTILPLVVISDLGAGGSAVSADRANEGEWKAFFDGLPAQLPVVVLNPYPPRRWPRALRRRAVILQWDRVTSPRLAWLAQTALERR
jgi:hypothetical protein